MDKKKFCVNIFLMFLLLYLAMYSSWYICFSNDMYYPVYYRLADIGTGVEKAAGDRPDDREDFRETTESEHFRLFKGVLDGVEHDGRGLESLKYHTFYNVNGFLSPVEISQLEDLAAEWKIFTSFLRLFILLTVVTCLYMVLGRVDGYVWALFTRGMSWVYVFCAVLIYFTGIAWVVRLCGALLFPARRDWFFYDPTSPLSLILPYPSAFVWIFLVLSVTTLAFWAVYYKMCSWLVRYVTDKMFRKPNRRQAVSS